MYRIKETQFLTGEYNIIIRNPEKEDAANLLNHMKIVNVETTFLAREPEEFTMTVEDEEKFIEAKLYSQTDLFIIAELEGLIIGTCGLKGSSFKRMLHKVDLGISIQKGYWGLGIGKELMNFSIGWAKENSIKKISLNVDTINYRAIYLYEKLGFEVEGRLIGDMRMADGNLRNSYLMALMLD